MVKHEHSLYSSLVLGERDLNVLLAKLVTVARMEGRNCRHKLVARLAHLPFPYPFIPPGLDSDALRKYRRTIPLSLLYVTRCSHQVSPFPFFLPSNRFRIPLDLRFCSNSSPCSLDRGWPGLHATFFSQLLSGNWRLDGSFSLTRITGKVSLPGSRRVINSFGSPAHPIHPASTDTCSLLPFARREVS